MENFTFADLFGEDMALSVPETPKKKEKKEKKESKPSAKKAGKEKKASGKDFDVTIPCQVLARGWQTTIEGTGTKKVSEIFKELYDAGYLEVKLSGVSAVYSGNKLYITSSLSSVTEDTAADLSEGSVTICDGQLHCEVTEDDFDGYDADEVSASMLLDKFIEQNPEYSGCRLAMEGNIAYPFFNASIPESETVKSCVLRISGHEVALDEEKTAGDIIKENFGEIPGVIVVLHYNLEKNIIFASYKAKNYVSVKKPFDTVKASDTKVEQKFKLPLKVLITTWNEQLELRPEDFEGKEKVTVDEIKDFLKPRHKIFSDTSRKLDYIFIEEKNLLSLMFISGKKGSYAEAESFGIYELLRSKDELLKCFEKECFHGTYVEGNTSIRVENLAHGIFLAKLKSEKGTVESLSFRAKLPKMPASIMDAVIAFFQMDLSKEAWVKVCYNKASGEYFFVKGKPQSVGKGHITFSMPTEGIIDNPSIIQVMEIHSHNSMPAFFSATDDADEIYPGLYGVVGRLDTEFPEVRIRAGYEGKFCEVPLDLIMEV